VVGWEWDGGSVTSEVDAATDASDQDLGQAPFNSDPDISENGQDLSQYGAEIMRERLPWVGMGVEVQLGLAGCRGEGT
jgi:hypothetical protein